MFSFIKKQTTSFVKIKQAIEKLSGYQLSRHTRSRLHGNDEKTLIILLQQPEKCSTPKFFSYGFKTHPNPPLHPRPRGDGENRNRGQQGPLLGRGRGVGSILNGNINPQLRPSTIGRCSDIIDEKNTGGPVET
jgi:hypothetical protein